MSPFVVVGGGPAGLTAAWELHRRGKPVVVFEERDRVGGIARTEDYRGYYFDIGGHRFFTKVARVERLWHEWLREDFLVRPRKSRIYYNGRLFHYPIKALDAALGLGPVECVAVLLSWVKAKLFPSPREENFEEWVSNRFGRRLYEIFFKTYTEKVWGIPCTEIRSEWAAQRIKGLSLWTAARHAIWPPSNEVIKTLIEQFHYPKLGPGQMWETVASQLQAGGHAVQRGAVVTAVHRRGDTVVGVSVRDAAGERRQDAAAVISSMALPELVMKLDPPAPAPVRAAACKLRHRDFLTVVLIVNRAQLFDDNWVYVHNPGVHVGRIQNFKNWSPAMVPDAKTTSLGLEYFCTEGDELWKKSDAELIALGARELAELGLGASADVLDGCVMRQPKAYPIYDRECADQIAIIKAYLATLVGLQTVGRNGLHKYNNQDHSMLTAIYAVENIFGAQHDLWQVNTERSYHEEVRKEADQPVDVLDASGAVQNVPSSSEDGAPSADVRALSAKPLTEVRLQAADSYSANDVA